MVPLPVDPEVEVNLRSRFVKSYIFMPKEFITEKSFIICCTVLEIWCCKDFLIEYANEGHVVN